MARSVSADRRPADLDRPAPDPPAVVGLRARAEAGPHDPVVLARRKAVAPPAVAPAQLEPVARLRGPGGQDLAVPEQLHVVVARPRHGRPPEQRTPGGLDDRPG